MRAEEGKGPAHGQGNLKRAPPQPAGRKPEVSVEEVALQSFSANVRSVLPPRASINVTLSLVALLKNPSKVLGFTYGESAAVLQYYGEEVGHVGIPAGDSRPSTQDRVHSSLVLQADRVASSSHLLPNVLVGSLPFSVSTVLSGRVKALRIFSRHIRLSSALSTSSSGAPPSSTPSASTSSACNLLCTPLAL